MPMMFNSPGMIPSVQGNIVGNNGIQMNPFMGSMTSLGPSPSMLQHFFNLQNAQRMHQMQQQQQQPSMEKAVPRFSQNQNGNQQPITPQPMMQSVAPSQQMTNQYMPQQEGMQEQPRLHTMPMRNARMIYGG